MRSNKEKWDYYLGIINERTNKFINSEIFGKDIPSVFYYVYPAGRLVEREIIGRSYSHRSSDGGHVHYWGKQPTREDVRLIKLYSESDIPFNRENIYFQYSEVWDVENGLTSKSSVKFVDLIDEVGGIFKSIGDAVVHSEYLIEKSRVIKEFRERYKDVDFGSLGFKFLGWQNGWVSEYYDEDKNLCSVSGKPRKSFGYSRENQPEYRGCIDSGHMRVEFQKTRSGSENVVACPECKIYWKYDCSD